MRQSWLLCLIAWIAPVAPIVAADAPHYQLRLSEPGASVDMRLCLGQAHAKVSFAADSKDALRYLSAVRRERDAPLSASEKGWEAKDWRAGECLSYRVDLDTIAQANDTDIGWRLGDDRVSAPQLLMLRPDTQDDAAATLSAKLPPGWNFSAPWTKLPSPRGDLAFRVPATPPSWSANVAFGHFVEDRISLPGGVLRVTVLHGADAAQRAILMAWIDRVAHAVLTAYGRMPLADVQVLVIPVNPRRKSAVLFGQSVRGQGNALQLLVNAQRPASEFADDWMAVHELSHLMHPYLGDRGAWLSEGLATYYQNVLRARGGIYTPAQAWQELGDGFRGAAAHTSDETLEHAAQMMHRTHGFQRVYWSGAAFWLTIDRDLRRASGGKQGLDTVLGRFRDCCLPAYGEWAPEDFIARLDDLANTKLIGERYREFATARTFPDWQGVFADLGVRLEKDSVAFDAQARDATLREAIMRAPSPSP
jgi:hypothetical protein